ncbi:cation channel sperm-associated auxiliary subunit epsilon isoform X10 [Saimiri boliviensis]|uniref:cation channel sperm-associated auxiliary subunit epsilon isoform X10 n=1 Tax=Saimiri boliviensis TaxID=27679 RepID=UPI003D777D2A
MREARTEVALAVGGGGAGAMSARGVAVLLSWLSCCGLAVWRYYSKSPDYRIFTTRSIIRLEYDGTLFIEWSVPETCTVLDKRFPVTELRCPSPGFYAVKPIVIGPDEEERYLFVAISNTCFLWYYRVRYFFNNLTQSIIVWAYDPENADPEELLGSAEKPSISKGRRSNLAVWTENEIYLGYILLKFARFVTTAQLKTILNLPVATTLTIHSVQYTGHPLEIAVFLNYCITCTVTKKIFLVIYNEDTKQWILQDLPLDAPIDSVFFPHFMFSALPGLILWNKHSVYYYYNNFTFTGILQTPAGHGNLSMLSNGSIIHEVLIDYYGNVLVKMENNVMFYSKINIGDAVRLHLWISNTTKAIIFLNTSGLMYFLYVFDDDLIQTEDYPLNLEAKSITLRTKDSCPYMAFHNNIAYVFYFLDKGEALTVWAQIVYPENNGLYVIMESYGPKILEVRHNISFEVAFGYCTKTLLLTFYQKINYEGTDDYFGMQNNNTGLVLIQVRPSEYSKACSVPQKVFQIAVGCDNKKFIAVKGFSKKGCHRHDFSYVIEKSYLRQPLSKNLKVRYNWKEYGCPLRLEFTEKFHPVVQLFDDNGYVKDVEANFIVWEIHGRGDYTFNNTMAQSGCLHTAQTWDSMIKLNEHLPLEEVWGPENYKHCFSYGIGKPGDLNQPYEIINSSNRNHIFWPMGHSGMYVFRVKILDPNYSFCNLTAIFAIETFGQIPSSSVYLVASFLFVLVLLFFTLLVLSYFWYMRIYRQYINEPLHKPPRKQKTN